MKTKIKHRTLPKLVLPAFCLLLICSSTRAQNIFPATGRAGIYTTSPAASLQVRGGARIGTLTNYVNIDSATGNLSFTGTATYRVANNQYAFQNSANPGIGLFFNSTNARYEFRNSSSSPTFYVGANTGNGVFIGNLKVGAYTLPATDGANGQLLKTNGAGTLTWSNDNTSGSGSGWLLTGNAGTDSSINFIGTTDAHSLMFRVNNQKSGWIDFTGNSNTSLGYQGLLANTTGFLNTALGSNTLKANVTGGRNTSIGAYTLVANNADNNTAIGVYALSSNTSGTGNTSAGVNALAVNTTGNNNAAYGLNALESNTTGNENTAAGYAALYQNQAGSYNAAFGKYALYNNNADNNTALGFNAMFFNTTGTGNTTIGITALQNNTTGSNNVAVGNYALGNNITGSNNTAIGFNAQVGVSTSVTNATAIGSNATVDISNAVVLGNNANVGIGTTSPASPLHIVSSISNNSLRVTTSGTSNDPSILLARNSGANDKFQINVRGTGGNSWLSIWDATNGSVDNGINVKGNNVGIGTAAPLAKLHLSVNGLDAYQGLAITNTNTGGKALTINQGTLGKLTFTNPGVIDLMTMDFTTNNVGIGTTSPGYKLDVCGTIRAKELRVETGWCDYVFEKNYKLKSIDELEKFITDNKHLPGIEPAEKVEKEGLKVGEMNKAMMEKIEELTLYVIQLSKENKKLQNEIELLKK